MGFCQDTGQSLIFLLHALAVIPFALKLVAKTHLTLVLTFAARAFALAVFAKAFGGSFALRPRLLLVAFGTFERCERLLALAFTQSNEGLERVSRVHIRRSEEHTS